MLVDHLLAILYAYHASQQLLEQGVNAPHPQATILLALVWVQSDLDYHTMSLILLCSLLRCSCCYCNALRAMRLVIKNVLASNGCRAPCRQQWRCMYIRCYAVINGRGSGHKSTNNKVKPHIVDQPRHRQLLAEMHPGYINTLAYTLVYIFCRYARSSFPIRWSMLYRCTIVQWAPFAASCAACSHPSTTQTNYLQCCIIKQRQKRA